MPLPKNVKDCSNYRVTQYGFTNGPYEVTRIASCNIGGSRYFLLAVETNKERVELCITGTGKIVSIHRVDLRKKAKRDLC